MDSLSSIPDHAGDDKEPMDTSTDQGKEYRLNNETPNLSERQPTIGAVTSKKGANGKPGSLAHTACCSLFLFAFSASFFFIVVRCECRFHD